MDTKSKKSKPFFSFLCLFLGFHCLIGCALSALYVIPRVGGWKKYYDYATAEDYQETDRFRQTMSASLYTAIQTALSSQDTDAEQSETQNPSLPDSPNLLYYIRYESKEIARSTAGAVSVSGKTPSFPEEYNFILHFNGKTVTAIKDGEPVDLYESGYYTMESDWELPGFQGGESTIFSSFPADQLVRCNIWLAARKDLLSVSSYDVLAGIQSEQQRASLAFFIWFMVLFVGLLLLLIYILMRASRKAFWQGAARVTAHFWFEWKLIVGAVLIFAVLLGLSMGPFVWADVFLWFFFFFVNDLRRNPSVWKHNGPMALCRFLERRRKLLPFQKRLLWHGPAVWIGVAVYLLLTIFFLMAFHGGFFIPMIPLTLLAAYFWYRSRKTFCVAVEETGRLLDRIHAVSGGESLPPLTLTFDSDLAQAASDLNSIESGIREAVERQISSERMKIELISNVSHDLKTPLTSIISYVQLLQEEELPDAAKGYVEILAKKAERLNTMVQDVFEVSKAATGNLTMQSEPLDLTKLVRQTMADMNEQIESSTLSFRVSLSEEAVLVYADGQKLYRVFQNLLENILRYSLEGTRVYLRQETDLDNTEITLRNVSREELLDSVDLTERFVRGDDSRTDGGSGLGLSIAKSFTEACGGSFRVETDGDLFTAIVSFPVFHAPQGEKQEPEITPADSPEKTDSLDVLTEGPQEISTDD